MSKIPKKVRIGPHDYDIKHDETTRRALKDAGSCGECYADRLEIRVDSDLPHTSCVETVLHEILHCCWRQTSLRVNGDTSEVEENVIAALSPLILNVLRSNPKLVKYLLSEDKNV